MFSDVVLQDKKGAFRSPKMVLCCGENKERLSMKHMNTSAFLQKNPTHATQFQ